MPTDHKLIGPKDLADATGLPLSWIYAKAEAGVLPHFKLGKYLKFRLPDVLAWIESHRKDVTPL